MGDKSRGDQKDRMRRILNLFRERGSAEDWPGLLGAVAQTPGVAPAPAPPPDLRGPGLRRDFFARTLDFAIFPRKSRRHWGRGSCVGVAL